MKNLLKSVMLIVIVVSFFSCESESLDATTNQEALRDAPLLSTGPVSCDGYYSTNKFVNLGEFDADFTIYDEQRNVLSFENGLQGNQSSDIKTFSIGSPITLSVSNGQVVIDKKIKVRSCMFYTFVINEFNQIRIYKSIMQQ